MRYQEQIKRIDKIARLLCRSSQRFRLRAGMTCMFAAAWWGVLYPELCFTEETCQTVAAAGAEMSSVSEDKKQNVKEQISYQELWKCTGEDIVVRSRLIEWLEQCADDFSK